MEPDYILGAFVYLSMLYTITPFVNGGCEKRRIPLCQNIRHTEGLFTTFFNSNWTQEEARTKLDKYSDILKSDCHNALEFVFCAGLAPMCDEHKQETALLPCRHVCTQVKKSCKSDFKRLKLPWPNELDCRSLPLKGYGNCLLPKIHTEYEVYPPPARCECKPHENRVGRSVYMSRRFSYVLKAIYQRADAIKRGPRVIKIYVVSVLKNSTVPITAGVNLTLWAERGCSCLKMRPGKEYLIMGYEDDNRRLLFDESCMAVKWKERWKHYIMKWEQKLTKQNAKNRNGIKKRHRRRRPNHRKTKRRQRPKFGLVFPT